MNSLLLASRINYAIQKGMAGDLQGAEAILTDLLKKNPSNPDIITNLCVALDQQRKYKEAEKLLKKALKSNPEHIGALSNLGSVLIKQGKPDQALPYLRSALRRHPHHIQATINLATALFQLGEVDQAATLYRESLAGNPREPHALRGMAAIHQSRNEIHQALDLANKSIASAPNDQESYSLLGNIYLSNNQPALACDAFRAALDLTPNHAGNRMLLALALAELNKLDEALKEAELAYSSNPYNLNIIHSLTKIKEQACAWDNLDELSNKRKRLLDAEIRTKGKTNTPPMTLIYDENISAEDQLRAAKAASKALDSSNKLSALSNTPKNDYPHKRIRLGYALADARNHPNGHNIVTLLSHHDRSRFEIYVYSFGVNDNSSVRKDIEQNSDIFIDAYGWPDDKLAAQIKNDGIDILIDLMGHTKDNRRRMLSLKPAPIVVNYLGYPGTTGADFVDYIIADPITIPVDHEKYYSEKVIRLPTTYQSNNLATYTLSHTSRSEHQLPEDAFVFCCINNPNKIRPKRFKVWMEILNECPNSVLWLMAKNEIQRKNLTAAAGKHGIAPERIIFADSLPRNEHLNRLQLADLFLDTSTYGAHTSASDALWAGVPVLTVLGNTFASRVCASLVSATGHPELIMPDEETYKATAIHFYQNRHIPNAIKQDLINNRDNLPLFNMESRARELENAFIEITSRHQPAIQQ